MTAPRKSSRAFTGEECESVVSSGALFSTPEPSQTSTLQATCLRTSAVCRAEWEAQAQLQLLGLERCLERPYWAEVQGDQGQGRPLHHPLPPDNVLSHPAPPDTWLDSDSVQTMSQMEPSWDNLSPTLLPQLPWSHAWR